MVNSSIPQKLRYPLKRVLADNCSIIRKESKLLKYGDHSVSFKFSSRVRTIREVSQMDHIR